MKKKKLNLDMEVKKMKKLMLGGWDCDCPGQSPQHNEKNPVVDCGTNTSFPCVQTTPPPQQCEDGHTTQ